MELPIIAALIATAGSAPLSIIRTTFMVNLHHLLMRAALAPHMTLKRITLSILFTLFSSPPVCSPAASPCYVARAQ
jgi:predicted branched-subunit amino acid permease